MVQMWHAIMHGDTLTGQAGMETADKSEAS